MPRTTAQRLPRATREHGRWAGWTAFVVGVVYAAVSAYWAAGGTAGLDTLGGVLAEQARARDTGLITIVWVTAVLKLVAALLGLALVQPWGLRLPRWALLTASWTATAVLTLYGGVLVVGQLLIAVDVFPRAEEFDALAFYWHLFVWDMWFLVWGLLLGAATVAFTRRTAAVR